MNAAESEDLHISLLAQGHFLGEQEQRIHDLADQVKQLPTRLSLAHMWSSSKSAKPERYDGNPAWCRGFQLQYQLYSDAIRGLSDQRKLTQLLGFLMDKVLLWAMVVWEQGAEAISTYENFVSLFKLVFDHASEGREVSSCILSFKQGQRGVVEYALEFRKLAVDSGGMRQPRRRTGS